MLLTFEVIVLCGLVFPEAKVVTFLCVALDPDKPFCLTPRPTTIVFKCYTWSKIKIPETDPTEATNQAFDVQKQLIF